MLTRRNFVALPAGAATLLAASNRAWSQAATPADATRFIVEFGNKMVGIVNEAGTAEQKKTQMEPLIEQAVAVDEIAQFVLGRYARIASPAQRERFNQLFHQVLILNVTSKLGEFRGVTFQPTQTIMRGAEAFVGTLITRPNQKPNNVQWVVSTAAGRPQIVDVVAEGTSLRLTQRSDYSAFLSRNGGNVDTLLAALERQVSS